MRCAREGGALFEEFRDLLAATRQKHPLWLERDADRPATDAELREAERQLGVSLPEREWAVCQALLPQWPPSAIYMSHSAPAAMMTPSERRSKPSLCLSRVLAPRDHPLLLPLAVLHEFARRAGSSRPSMPNCPLGLLMSPKSGNRVTNGAYPSSRFGPACIDKCSSEFGYLDAIRADTDCQVDRCSALPLPPPH
jgi:hypothetical protein